MKLVTFFLFMVSTSVFASHLKLSCDSAKNLTTFDYDRSQDAALLLQLGEQDRQQALSRICDNAIDCVNHLGALAELGGDVTAAMEVIERREFRQLLDLSRFNAQDPSADEVAQLQDHLRDLNALLDGCRSSGSNLLRQNSLTLLYPWKGRGSVVTSAAYDRSGLEDIIRKAAFQGVDPYFAIAITMLENPPVSTPDNPWSQNPYAAAYGNIPIDAVAAYDLMGCYPRGTSSTELHEAALVKPATEINLRIGNSNQSAVFCASQVGVAGAAPRFDLNTRSMPGRCCMTLSGVSSTTSYRDVLDALGMRLMKQIQTNSLRDQTNQGGRGRYFALGYNAQRYNGLGTFGATEQMNNRCISMINMAQRPVYGLLVHDLISNSLMTNSALNTIVTQTLERINRPHKSVYCQALGNGEHQLDSREFLTLQRDLLLNYEHPRANPATRARETRRRQDCTRRGETFEPYSQAEAIERLMQAR